MAQRQYEQFTLFNVRIADMRHLWNPSDTYKGQKQQKPNYFGGFLVKKTQATWAAEPVLAGLVAAYGKLYATNPQIVDWRIEDGDTPNTEGKSSEHAKGNWLFNASSSQPPNVELVQTGGTLVKLTNKVGVKSGDYCMVGGTAAMSGQNPRAAKLYLNAVVFSSPGEEIVFANSVSGAELMKMAQQQGLQVAGFTGTPGFTQPSSNPGFAPMTSNPALAAVQASAGPGFGGYATFPSSMPAFNPGPSSSR
jgi:Protein of unknown function (DUF2815)